MFLKRGPTKAPQLTHLECRQSARAGPISYGGVRYLVARRHFVDCENFVHLVSFAIPDWTTVDVVGRSPHFFGGIQPTVHDALRVERGESVGTSLGLQEAFKLASPQRFIALAAVDRQELAVVFPSV